MRNQLATLLATACLLIAPGTDSNCARAGGGRVVVSHCGSNKVCVPVQRVVAAPVVEKVVAHQAVAAYEQPPIQNINFYSVGQGVAQEAVMARAVRSALEEWVFEAQAQTTINGSLRRAAPQAVIEQQPRQAYAPTAAAGGQAGGQAAGGVDKFSVTAPPTGGAFAQACARCHSGSTSEGGFNIADADAGQLLSAVGRVVNGTMPPNQKLTAERRTQVAADISAMQLDFK